MLSAVRAVLVIESLHSHRIVTKTKAQEGEELNLMCQMKKQQEDMRPWWEQ